MLEPRKIVVGETKPVSISNPHADPNQTGNDYFPPLQTLSVKHPPQRQQLQQHGLPRH